MLLVIISQLVVFLAKAMKPWLSHMMVKASVQEDFWA